MCMCFKIGTGDGIQVLQMTYGNASMNIILAKTILPNIMVPGSLSTMKHALMNKMQGLEKYILNLAWANAI